MAGSPESFDAVVGLSDPAMVVVTAKAGGERSGCLVGFHTQSSIEPRHYCVWISKTNHTADVVARADVFAVHLLSTSDRDLAVLFGGTTGDDIDKFSRCDFTEHPLGPPLLDACQNTMILERVSLADDGGDHTCLTGRLLEAHADGRPFAALRLSAAGDIEPGHQSRE